jgi:hypothetical protein
MRGDVKMGDETDKPVHSQPCAVLIKPEFSWNQWKPVFWVLKSYSNPTTPNSVHRLWFIRNTYSIHSLFIPSGQFDLNKNRLHFSAAMPSLLSISRNRFRHKIKAYPSLKPQAYSRMSRISKED